MNTTTEKTPRDYAMFEADISGCAKPKSAAAYKNGSRLTKYRW